MFLLLLTNVFRNVSLVRHDATEGALARPLRQRLLRADAHTKACTSRGHQEQGEHHRHGANRTCTTKHQT